MGITYPISAVARMTGIPLDTLRAWERRYAAVSPKRAQRGRVYTEQQIKRLVLLRKVVAQGYAIGQVARVHDKGLHILLEKAGSLADVQSTGSQEETEKRFASIVQAISNYDYAWADRELSRMAAAIANPRDLVHRVALPLMHHVGEGWHAGQWTIAQEHMATSLLSSLLGSFVRVHTPSDPPAKVLLSTPHNERHGFPALAAALLAAGGGLGVIYLGADLPAEEIITAARKSRTNAVLLSLSAVPNSETLGELRQIAHKLPRTVHLWLGGPPELFVERLSIDPRWQIVDDFVALEQKLVALGARY